jgi:hypothetical protein
MITRTVIFSVLIYLAIGRLMHESTEPYMRNKSISHYNNSELIVLCLDLFFWLPLLIISTFKSIKK